MRLADLHPKWFEYGGEIHGFTFLCPHCQGIRLACALKPMNHMMHREIFGDDNQHHGHEVVGVQENSIWQQPPDRPANDFATMTITPSINASASGHWHGFITNGEVK